MLVAISPIRFLVRPAYNALIAVVFVAGAVAANGASVQCEPEIVSFSGLDEVATIGLYEDGSPLPSSALNGARAMIDDNNYSYQFIIERSESGPAQLTIRPNPALVQIGTFTLRISTDKGPAVAQIKTPLDELPGTLENRAKALGISEQQLKAEMNLLQSVERERVGVTLPAAYPEGHLFELPLGEDPSRNYVWYVNGEVVSSGKGQGTLQHVFTMVGPNIIQFEERNDDGLVSAWRGTLQVNPTPTIPWKVPADTEFTLEGPPGFNDYTWLADGKLAGTGRVLRHTFDFVGDHTIECLAREPENGDAAEYRRMTWEVIAE